MLGRFCYSVVPIFFTLSTLALALVSFFGSFRTHSAGLDNIYFLRLNFTNITVEGFDVSTLVTDAGIHQIYQVGANGYCYGENTDIGTGVNITDCVTPTVPFWFDLLGVFEHSKAGNILNKTNIPEQVQQYMNILKKASTAMWSLLIATCALSFIIAIVGIFSFWSKGLSLCIFLIALLNFLTAAAAAAVGTGLYCIYSNKFNDTVSEFGATATLGRNALGLIWGMVGAALLAAIFWLFTICFGSARNKQDKQPVDDYDNKVNY